MATPVHIYKPSKTAMQSGRANTKRWVLEFEPAAPQQTDALMGWSGSPDTNRQLKLFFSSKEDAIDFAKRKRFTYVLKEYKERNIRPKVYADNFAFTKVT